MQTCITEQGIIDGFLWWELVLLKTQVCLIAMLYQCLEVFCLGSCDIAAQLVLVDELVVDDRSQRIDVFADLCQQFVEIPL